MDSLPFKFNLQIPAMLYGQPTFQHLHFTFPQCQMDSPHFNFYTSDSLRAIWTAYISTFTPQIFGMLHGEPTSQHFLFRFPHSTGTAYISTFTLQIPAMLHGEPTYQHFLFRFPPCYRNSLLFNIYSADSCHATWTVYI